MPQPDHEIIRVALPHVLPETCVQDLNPRAGTLIPSADAVQTAADALARFNGLDGPGWLQEALTSEILHTQDPARTAKLKQLDPGTVWPVTGERVSADGKRSLHLRRTAGDWTVTTLEEASDANGVLLTQRRLSTDLKSYLVYHVAYRTERIGGHDELRPFASRFVGFKAVTEQTGPASAAAVPPTP